LRLATLLIDNGFTPYSPIIDEGCDFIVETPEGRLIKVQAKSTYVTAKDGTYLVSTAKGSGASKKIGTSVDVLAVYISHEDIWYFIPTYTVDSFKIRIKPHKNKCLFNAYKNNLDIFDLAKVTKN
jgi:uncharacterized protein YneR